MIPRRVGTAWASLRLRGIVLGKHVVQKSYWNSKNERIERRNFRKWKKDEKGETV